MIATKDGLKIGGELGGQNPDVFIGLNCTEVSENTSSLG